MMLHWPEGWRTECGSVPPNGMQRQVDDFTHHMLAAR